MVKKKEQELSMTLQKTDTARGIELIPQDNRDDILIRTYFFE